MIDNLILDIYYLYKLVLKNVKKLNFIELSLIITTIGVILAVVIK